MRELGWHPYEMPCRIPRGSLRRLRRRKRAGPSIGRGSVGRGPCKRTSGSVVVLSAGGGGGSRGGEGCRRRDLERRTSGGRGVPCLATISSSVAGSAGGCGPVVGLPSYKKRQGITAFHHNWRIEVEYKVNAKNNISRWRNRNILNFMIL